MHIDTDFFIKKGYTHRTDGDYFDAPSYVSQNDIVHQPAVYHLADFLGERFGCTHLIDLGCGAGRKLVESHPKFKLIGIDYGSNLTHCKAQYPFGDWIKWNLEDTGIIPIATDILRNSIVICADVIEHLRNPRSLLKNLAHFSEYARAIIMSSPERDLLRGVSDFGPPENPAHVREWNLTELKQYITSMGLNIAFSGLTVNNSVALEKKNSLVIVGNKDSGIFYDAPENFRVVALMSSFNEEDIIEYSISNLIDQGIEVYLIDNWSSDSTRQRVQHLLGRGLIDIEKFPHNGPSKYYNWKEILTRKEELARSIPASWFVHQDPDEVRESPWAGLKLRDAVYHVDRLGFNAIDHTVINFVPVNNLFQTGNDLVKSFSFFEFWKNPGHFVQIKTWKNQTSGISLAESGGHDAKFEGRRIYPYKFLLRHYPVRSQDQGYRKIFEERRERFDPEEKAKGWHSHYDRIQPGHNFLGTKKELTFFDDNFYEHYLVERLSGIGIRRTRSS